MTNEENVANETTNAEANAPVFDETTPLEALQAAANGGNLDALCELAWRRKHGVGVERDPSDAVRLFRRAAEAGSATAANNLGLCFDEGVGVPQNFDEAASWFRRAADAGDAAAQNNLGWAYLNGARKFNLK